MSWPLPLPTALGHVLQLKLQVRAHQHISALALVGEGGLPGKLGLEIDVSLATIWIWPRSRYCCCCYSCVAFACLVCL